MPLFMVLADISGGGMGEVLTCGVSSFELEMTGTWMSVDNTSSLQIKDTRNNICSYCKTSSNSAFSQHFLI